MASSKEYLHFILEQLSDLDDVSYRPMMGEFILYYHGKIVGGIYDDRLLVKKQDPLWNLCPRQFVNSRMRERKKCCWWMKLTAKSFLQSCLRQCTMNCHRQNERTTECGRNCIHGSGKNNHDGKCSVFFARGSAVDLNGTVDCLSLCAASDPQG